MVYGKVKIHSPQMHTDPHGRRCKMDRVDESTTNSNGAAQRNSQIMSPPPRIASGVHRIASLMLREAAGAG